MSRQVLVTGILFLVVMLTGVSLFAADVQSSNYAQAVIVVDSFSDALDSGDGCTLREAIMNANSNSDTTAGECVSGAGSDTIIVPAGTYTLDIKGAGEDGNTTGDLDITDDLTINGAGSNDTTINGNQHDRVIHVLNGAAVQVTDLTITEGLVTNESGGGLLNSNGYLTLTNSLVSHNVVSGTNIVGGGGVASTALTATVSTSFQNSQVYSNTSQAGNGGGVFVRADPGLTAQLTITDCNVHDNKSLGSGGGVFAIFADLSGTQPGQTLITIERSVIDGNIALGGNGGGVMLSGNIGQLKSTIIDSTLSNNIADGTLPFTGVGGGMYNKKGETLFLRSTASGNWATSSVLGALGSGGGIGNEGLLEVANATISDNHADAGGSNGFLEGIGGGIASVAVVTLTNSTVADNSASVSGGGIDTTSVFNAATTTFENTIVADNSAPIDASCTNGSGVQNSTGNNLEDGNTCNFSQASDQRNTDPLLEPLAENGGPTKTQALAPGSPAIDAGNNSTCAVSPIDGIDQRGFKRPYGPDCDIGAYEVGPRLYVPIILK